MNGTLNFILSYTVVSQKGNTHDSIQPTCPAVEHNNAVCMNPCNQYQYDIFLMHLEYRRAPKRSDRFQKYHFPQRRHSIIFGILIRGAPSKVGYLKDRRDRRSTGNCPRYLLLFSCFALNYLIMLRGWLSWAPTRSFVPHLPGEGC